MTIPFERAYWVLPGRFLAGRIPSSSKIEKIRADVEGLVKLGVSCVINLTEKGEMTYENKILNDYEVILQEVAKENNHQIEVVRMSIKDLSIPTNDYMKQILDKIDQLLAEKKVFYVHCWGGIGRTGTVVGCFLRRHNHVAADKILDMIAYLKRTTDLVNKNSPETPEQRDFVVNYAE